MNLLPLCCNCHLRDQHNPARKIDIPKLQLFRKYKTPAILKPQFHPIYTRQLFLETIEVNEECVREIESQAKELIQFIKLLEMGEFYSNKLNELIGPLNRALVSNMFDSKPNPQVGINNQDYRKKLIEKREPARTLLIEQLRFQDWANAYEKPLRSFN